MTKVGAGTRAIVFDGDDTLWSTEQLYDEARRAARRLVEEAGNDGARWEELERRLDVENVETHGHSAERFPTSCVQAYKAVCREQELRADPAVAAAVAAAGRAVFEREAPLLPHARETLAQLRARGFRLALLTKGDSALQRRRVEQSGLAPLFDIVEVVDRKTPETIRSVLDDLGVDADSVLSVGNSIRSDILPSLAAGVRPVWIDAHVWEYEHHHDVLDDDRVLQVDDLSRLLEVATT